MQGSLQLGATILLHDPATDLTQPVTFQNVRSHQQGTLVVEQTELKEMGAKLTHIHRLEIDTFQTRDHALAQTQVLIAVTLLVGHKDSDDKPGDRDRLTQSQTEILTNQLGQTQGSDLIQIDIASNVLGFESGLNVGHVFSWSYDEVVIDSRNANFSDLSSFGAFYQNI